MYIKYFDKWNFLKKRINSKNNRKYIRKGEIYWASIGVNVGSEIDGKGDTYTRPVLIIDTVGDKLCLVVPLTTNNKKSPRKYSLFLNNRLSSIYLDQIKIISTKRILDRVGKISDNKLIKIKVRIRKFYDF